MITPHFRLKPTHLVIVVEVVYPYVLLHVGVIKILPEPVPITPVEVPLTITVRERREGMTWLTGWRLSNYKSPEVPLTLWPLPSLAFVATHQRWCWWAHTCTARTGLPWGRWRKHPLEWVGGMCNQANWSFKTMTHRSSLLTWSPVPLWVDTCRGREKEQNCGVALEEI